jgi:SPP1 family predicted phage head-tail adaptor
MRAGELDRRISLMRNQPSQSARGGLTDNWVAIATLYASVKYDRGGERFATQQVVGQGIVTFRVRWDAAWSDFNVKDRVSFDGRDYDVRDVREIGRREGIEIDATARSEVPLAAG